MSSAWTDAPCVCSHFSSNILVGLVSLPELFAEEKPPLPPGHRPRLAHLPLFLILTRGRPTVTLALVGSSPLWQPLDDLEERGWDVCLLQRVKASMDVGPKGVYTSEGSSVEEGAVRIDKRRSKGVKKEQAVDEYVLPFLLSSRLSTESFLIVSLWLSQGAAAQDAHRHCAPPSLNTRLGYGRLSRVAPQPARFRRHSRGRSQEGLDG